MSTDVGETFRQYSDSPSKGYTSDKKDLFKGKYVFKFGRYHSDD